MGSQVTTMKHGTRAKLLAEHKFKSAHHLFHGDPHLFLMMALWENVMYVSVCFPCGDRSWSVSVSLLVPGNTPHHGHLIKHNLRTME